MLAVSTCEWGGEGLGGLMRGDLGALGAHGEILYRVRVGESSGKSSGIVLPGTS